MVNMKPCKLLLHMQVNIDFQYFKGLLFVDTLKIFCPHILIAHNAFVLIFTADLKAIFIEYFNVLTV
jgi:hypothetical protein